MTPPRKEAGSSGRPLPADLSPITTSPSATAKSGKGSSPTKKSGTSAAKSKNAKVSPNKVSKTPDKSKEPFRYRWMKKITPSNDETSGREKQSANALQEPRATKGKAGGNEKSAKKTTGPSSPQKFEKLIDFNATAGAAPKKSTAPPSTPRKFLFGTKPTNLKDNDTQMKDAGDSDDEQYNSDVYESCEDEEDDGCTEYTSRIGTQGTWIPPVDEKGQPIGPDHPLVPQSVNNMEKARKKTKADVEDPNGRVHGRKLVHWHRVRMMEKLLLILQYECHRDNIIIPWDRIVHRLQPGSSGPSATQHLNKMRDILVLEGHMVPPPMGKPTIPQDNTIRGFIRDFNSDTPTTTRIVGWTEVVEHRKESLQVEGIVRGSGNYARGEDGRRSTTGAARNRPRPKAQLPAAYLHGVESVKMSVARDSQKKRRERARKAKRAIDAEELGEIPDPAELPSDEDWSPQAKKKARTSRRRSTRKSAVKPEPRSDVEAPSMMQFGQQEEAISKDQSLPIKLVMSPEHLAKFPAGPSGTPASEFLNQTIENDNTAEDDVTDDEGTHAEVDEDEADEEYEEYEEHEQHPECKDYEQAGEEEHVEDDAQDFVSPNTRFNNNYGNRPNAGYQGPAEHGTFDEWYAAVHAGIDPRVNGTKYKIRQGFSDTNAESDALPRADPQALDHPTNRYAAAQAHFANAHGFGAVMQPPFQTKLGSQLQNLGLNPHDDPFVDHSVHTPPHASQPYDMAQQLAGDNTPPYHSFASPTSNLQTSANMSSPHGYNSLPQDVHGGHLNGYTEMNATSPYDNQILNNSLATSSDSDYRHGDGDFVHSEGRIYQDHGGHITRMMGFGEGWPVGASHMGGYLGPQSGYQQHHFDERDENDHPSGLQSPGYVPYNDQAHSHQ